MSIICSAYTCEYVPMAKTPISVNLEVLWEGQSHPPELELVKGDKSSPIHNEIETLIDVCPLGTAHENHDFTML